MRRWVSVLLIGFFSIPASPSWAQDWQRALKNDHRRPRIVHQGDWTLAELSLTPELRKAARTLHARSKSLFLGPAYASISRPSLIGGIDAFDVLPLEFSRYYYGIVIFNLGGRRSVNVKLTIVGPRRLTGNGSLSLSGNSVTVAYYSADPLNRIGRYTMKWKVPGAKPGHVLSSFCAGC